MLVNMTQFSISKYNTHNCLNLVHVHTRSVSKLKTNKAAPLNRHSKTSLPPSKLTMYLSIHKKQIYYLTVPRANINRWSNL
jgi:hypothetical protein